MPTIGVAVAIPEPWASELQDYRTAVGDTTATMIPTHITLVPPIEIDDLLVADVEKHLEEVAAEIGSYCVHLRGTGTFRPVSPVVFVTLVEGISQCEQLAGAVRRGPLDVELQYPFHPHVTIAHHLEDPLLDRAFEELAALRVRVRRLRLPPLRPRRGRGLAADPTLRPPGRGRLTMPSPQERLAELRRRRPIVDHAVRMQEHYGAVKAGQQAGAVTYFGFLSFFPILALAFFVVGLLAKVYSDAGDNLTEAINSVMPGVLGTDQGQTTLDQIEKYATTVGIIGAVGAALLRPGLGRRDAVGPGGGLRGPAAGAAELRLRQAPRPPHPRPDRRHPHRLGRDRRPGRRLLDRDPRLAPAERGARLAGQAAHGGARVRAPTCCSSTRCSCCWPSRTRRAARCGQVPCWGRSRSRSSSRSRAC